MPIPSSSGLTWSQTLFCDLVLPRLLQAQQLDYRFVNRLARLNHEIALKVAAELLNQPYSSLHKPLHSLTLDTPDPTVNQGRQLLRKQQVMALVSCLRLYHYFLVKTPLSNQARDLYGSLLTKLIIISCNEWSTFRYSDRLTHVSRVMLALTKNIGIYPGLQPIVKEHLTLITSESMARMRHRAPNDTTTFASLCARVEHDASLLTALREHSDLFLQAWLTACALAYSKSIGRYRFVSQAMRLHQSSLASLTTQHGLSPRPLTRLEHLLCENFFLRQQLQAYQNHPFDVWSLKMTVLASFCLNFVALGLILLLALEVDRHRYYVLGVGMFGMVMGNTLHYTRCHKDTYSPVITIFRLQHNQRQLATLTPTQLNV